MDLALIRDVALIFLVIEVTIALIVLAVYGGRAMRLLSDLHAKLLPLIGRAEHALDTVEGTTHVVNEAVVSPVIRAASYATGARRVVQSLLRRDGRRKEE